MARLYFDHNVTRHVGPDLWATGHDLIFTRDSGSARLTDDAHLVAAVHANRVLITHGREDFTLLHDAWVTWPSAFGLALPEHPGILVLNSASPPTLARALSDFLAATPAGYLVNRIFWWHRRDVWSQRAPHGRWARYQPGDEPER